MRGVRVTERGVEVLDVAEPTGDGARLTVRSASICGSPGESRSTGWKRT